MSERCKLIIAGTRSFNDYELLRSILSTLFMKRHCWTIDWNEEIVSGGAPGADTLAVRYATEADTSRLKYFRLIGKSTVEAQAHAVTGRWRNTRTLQ